MVILFFPPEPRIYGLGERDVAERSAFRRWFFRQVPIFLPLDRDHPRAALASMQSALTAGAAIGLAPEGRLGTQEGALGPLQDGAAFLSVRTGAPLLPVGATGTLDLWFRKQLTLRIGAPIDPAEFWGDSHSRVRALTARLDHDLRALFPGDAQHPSFKPLRHFLTHLF